MNVFVKTFFITLLICVTFFVYKYLGGASYSPNLMPNENFTNSGFSKNDIIIPDSIVEDEASPDVIVCFVNSDLEPVCVKKKAQKNNLENAIKSLLNTYNEQDPDNNLYSEIPKGTKLLSLRDENGKIIINLSKEFEAGGGTQSFQARLIQLVKTVNHYSQYRPTYLYLEGERVEYIGGEGIYLKQPLSDETINF